MHLKSNSNWCLLITWSGPGTVLGRDVLFCAQLCGFPLTVAHKA